MPRYEARYEMPTGMYVYATPEGWRHSIFTENSMICGHLYHVPEDADDAQATRAATEMLCEYARDFHGADITVSWTAEEPGKWMAEVIRAG
ncbi:hypothetical protein AB0C65_12875 [Nocardia sp. NPDC048505]|uniref:hypothetical protein n=1 Tax=Nocardia sp. NPDC048505 TaxID=3155756 RepID=UPI0033CD64F2